MKVVLEEYNPLWEDIFEKEKSLIEVGFPEHNFQIEHIGSTAVPGLKAKSIIDIMIGVNSFDNQLAIVKHLTKLGYQYIDAYNELMPERRFFLKEINGKRAFHLHLCILHSEFWERHLLFRDELRNNEPTRNSYEELKEALAKKEWSSQNEYADAKKKFIQSVERELKK